MSVVIIIIGGAATYCSMWLLFHVSDKRVLRLIRPRWNPKMPKSEVEAYRATNIIFLAVVLMVMGALLLTIGVLRLFGVVSG